MPPRAVASLLAALSLLPLRALAEDRPAAPAEDRPAALAEDRPAAPATAPSTAPSASTAEEERRALEERIARELGAAPDAPSAPVAQAPAAAPPAGSTGASPLARLLLLPDVSAVARFAIAHDTYDVEALSPREGPYGPEDRPQPLFQEVELALQSIVDPYLRADLFLAFGPDGVDVEEAYATTLGLPAGLQLRAGKLFSPFGRENQQHPHVWDFVDAPLARERLVAAEPLGGPGVDVAWLAPLPWFAELHLAGQATAPGEGDTEELTAIARLLQYFPLAPTTTLGVGLSAARRREAAGAFRDLGGVDAYVRWRPISGRTWVTLQGELFARRFRGTAGERDAGGYAQAFWRQGPRYGVGVRYDDAPAAGEAAPGTERRWGALATWFPSEYQRVRLQVSWDERPGGRGGLEALLALELGIGAHGAHPF